MDNSANWAETPEPSKYFARDESVTDVPPDPSPDDAPKPGPKPRRERKLRGAMLKEGNVWRNDETALHDPARMAGWFVTAGPLSTIPTAG